MTTIDLLKEFGTASKKDNRERALWHLLKTNEKEITGIVEGDPEYFHKAFRQIDVCKDGHMDMAIWLLLDEARLFWKVFDTLKLKDELSVNLAEKTLTQ